MYYTVQIAPSANPIFSSRAFTRFRIGKKRNDTFISSRQNSINIKVCVCVFTIKLRFYCFKHVSLGTDEICDEKKSENPVNLERAKKDPSAYCSTQKETICS